MNELESTLDELLQKYGIRKVLESLAWLCDDVDV